MMTGAALFAAEACLGSHRHAVAEAGYRARVHHAGSTQEPTHGKGVEERASLADGKSIPEPADEETPVRDDVALSQAAP
ncbi:MAG TPA: hypothetical protein VM925_07985 [Labilithrix sp.]|jgi:hypothetical protein|nr:hypothetical protein [Labilithrix sp.]